MTTHFRIEVKRISTVMSKDVFQTVNITKANKSALQTSIGWPLIQL